jgi:hypothetical protein
VTGKKTKPKTRPGSTDSDLERAVQTLMCTDDYAVLSRTADAVTVVYIHSGYPQDAITLTSTPRLGYGEGETE